MKKSDLISGKHANLFQKKTTTNFSKAKYTPAQLDDSIKAQSHNLGSSNGWRNNKFQFPTTLGNFSLNLGSNGLKIHQRRFTDAEAASAPITVNLTNCRYPVVHEEAKKLMWKVISKDDDQSAAWDLFWADTAQPVEYFKGLQLYQKVNHFPGMYNIHRKNHLAEHLEKMRKHFPEQYSFYPKTWLLPKDHPDILQNLKKGRVLIAKPCDQAQGRGIFILTDPEDLNKCSGKKLVVQEYIERPLIYNNLKFDLRIYVLVTGCDPLRVYLFRDGLVRFATEHYERPTEANKRDRYRHLTNYAVNKHNKNFKIASGNRQSGNEMGENDHSFKGGARGVGESIREDDLDDDHIQEHGAADPEDMDDSEGGEKKEHTHKQCLSEFFATLSEQGYKMDRVWKDIQTLAVKTLISIQPRLAHCYKVAHTDDPFNHMCFELLGLDVLVDWSLKVHLLEVNHAPSLWTDSWVDQKVKAAMLGDVLNMVDLSVDVRRKLIELKKDQMAEISLTGKRSRLSQGEVRDECLAHRASVLDSKCGDFQRIYPALESKLNLEYAELLKQAETNYHEFTGAEMISAEMVRAMKYQDQQPKGGAFKSQTFSNLKTSQQIGVSYENINNFTPNTLNYSQIESLYGNTSGLRRLKQMAKVTKPQKAQVPVKPRNSPQILGKSFDVDVNKAFKIRSGTVGMPAQSLATPARKDRPLLPYEQGYSHQAGRLFKQQEHRTPLKDVYGLSDETMDLRLPRQPLRSKNKTPERANVHLDSRGPAFAPYKRREEPETRK